MKRLIRLFLIEILVIFILESTVLAIYTDEKEKIADVGSFESYDSGSSGGYSSSYDSGSSSYDGGYSYDYSYDSSTGSYTKHRVRKKKEKPNKFFTAIACIVPIGVLIVFFIILNSMNKDEKDEMNKFVNRKHFRTPLNLNDRRVEQEIRKNDPNFNKTEFMIFSKKIFLKLQEAWTKRDWEEIRLLESRELFEQHQKQLDGYIKMGQINVLENISVLGVRITDYTYNSETRQEKIDVIVTSRMNDYIIDANTKTIVKGNKRKYYENSYKLTFIKSKNSSSNPNEAERKVKCPNCGSIVTVTANGKCNYCNSLITTNEFGWILVNYTRITNI